MTTQPRELYENPEAVVLEVEFEAAVLSGETPVTPMPSGVRGGWIMSL